MFFGCKRKDNKRDTEPAQTSGIMTTQLAHAAFLPNTATNPATVRTFDDMYVGFPNASCHDSKRRRLDVYSETAVHISNEFVEPCSHQPTYDNNCNVLPLVETGLEGWKPCKLLKIPDAIEAIARNGKALSYDPTNNTYTVLNGELFHTEFNELRAIRQKKNEAAKDRPFSRMHRFYTLLQGEKWARTGSVFAPKQLVVPNSPSSTEGAHEIPRSPSLDLDMDGVPVMAADSVSVSLVGANGVVEHVSLQHLLDLCGATQICMKATSGWPHHPLHQGLRVRSARTEPALDSLSTTPSVTPGCTPRAGDGDLFLRQESFCF